MIVKPKENIKPRGAWPRVRFHEMWEYVNELAKKAKKLENVNKLARGGGVK